MNITERIPTMELDEITKASWQDVWTKLTKFRCCVRAEEKVGHELSDTKIAKDELIDTFDALQAMLLVKVTAQVLGQKG